MNAPYTTIDEYIEMFPPHVRGLLEQMRRAVKEAAPQAVETISYRIPAFMLNGSLVWFAAFKDHIGFYPKASGIEVFKKELAPYKLSKGTVQFPLDKPLPLELVKKIVAYRAAENLGGKKE